MNQTFEPFVPNDDERLVSQGVINFELREREFRAVRQSALYRPPAVFLQIGKRFIEAIPVSRI